MSNGRWDTAFDHYLDAYNKPGFDFDLNVMRIVVGAFFIWKLLSRDFSFYGLVPDGVFPMYPLFIYSFDTYVLTTGLPVISELATFHWIHWLVPYPGGFVLTVLQFLAIACITLWLIFGRGPRRIFAISSYVLLVYLWGYLFIGGQEIDAVALYFGLLLVLCLSPYEDRPVYRIGQTIRDAPNVRTGRTFSLCVLVFVFYYFASGVNKITDLTPFGWFSYDLVRAMEFYSIRAAYSTVMVPSAFEVLFDEYWLGRTLPALVYLSHLIVPVLFFRRHHVYKFMLFYAGFHFFAFGVGISFTGYIFVWLALIPYAKIIARLRSVSGNSAVAG